MRDLRVHRGVEHRHIPGLVRAVRRCQLQLAFRLVVGAPLQVGPHDGLAHPVRGGPRPERLGHRQRRAQVTQRLVARTGLAHLEAQFADPGMRGGPEPGAATALERGERPPGRRQRAVQVARLLPGVAGHVVGHARDQRLVALAQRLQGREVRLGRPVQRVQHGLRGPGEGVRRSGRQPPQAHQEPRRARPPQQETAHRAEHQAGPGGLDQGGFRPERRQDPGRVPGQGGQPAETRLGRPQPAQHGRHRGDRSGVPAVEPVPQGLDQVVLLGPDQLEGREVVAGEQRVVVGDAEVTGPGEEPAGHALGLAGVLAGAPRRTPGRSPASGSGHPARCR